MQLRLFRRQTNFRLPGISHAGIRAPGVVEGRDLIQTDDDLIDFAGVRLFAAAKDHRSHLAELRLPLHIVASEVALVEDLIQAGAGLYGQDREDERAYVPVIRLEIGDAHVRQIHIGFPSVAQSLRDGSIGFRVHVFVLPSSDYSVASFAAFHLLEALSYFSTCPSVAGVDRSTSVRSPSLMLGATPLPQMQ